MIDKTLVLKKRRISISEFSLDNGLRAVICRFLKILFFKRISSRRSSQTHVRAIFGGMAVPPWSA